MKKWVFFIVTLSAASVLSTFDKAAAEIIPITSSDLPVSGDYRPEGGGALDDLMKSLIEMKTFDAESHGLEGNYEIIEEISVKLEEDGEVARARLVALRREGGVYNRGFLLEIIPSGDDPFVIPLADDVKGFEASIAPKNFISREKSEIFLTVGGDTWGDRFLIIAVAGEHGEVVLDTYAEKIPAAAGRFFNDYRAEIIIQDTGERALIDLSPRKAFYDRRSVYNDTGFLRRKINVRVNNFSRFEPVDLDHDGIMEIKEVMNLNGVGRADRIAYVEASLKYAGGAWIAFDSWIAPAEDLNKMPMPRRIDLDLEG